MGYGAQRRAGPKRGAIAADIGGNDDAHSGAADADAGACTGCGHRAAYRRDGYGGAIANANDCLQLQLASGSHIDARRRSRLDANLSTDVGELTNAVDIPGRVDFAADADGTSLIRTVTRPAHLDAEPRCHALAAGLFGVTLVANNRGILASRGGG